MNDDLYGHDTIERLERLAILRIVKHHGRNVAWRRFGDGPPLVLIHGGHGSWLHWIRNIETLSEKFTLWLPDLPGFGDSDDLPGHPHAADRMACLVEAVASTLSTLVGPETEVGVVGFSFGALVAARLVAERGYVPRMALLGAAGHGGTRRQQAVLLNWRLSDPEAMRSALLKNVAAFMLHDASKADALALAVYARCCIRTRFRSKSIARLGGLSELLDCHRQNLLLIWGEHDVTATPEELVPRLTEGHRLREAHIGAGAGHWVQFEQHAEINERLANWFGR
ncbi:MAG: alpha/beta fold hydrolase [Pseudomonadota bacterium]